METETITCPHCKSDDVPAAATHCRHCGRKLAVTSQRRLIIRIVVAVLVVAMIAMAVKSQIDGGRRNKDFTSCIAVQDPANC